MKSAVVFVAIVAAACAVEFYSEEKYHKIDIEDIIKDEALLKSFLSCFIDNATCDDFTGQFKEDFADSVKTACTRCSPLEKHIIRRFMEGSRIVHPALLTVLGEKVDPKKVKVPALLAVVANA